MCGGARQILDSEVGKACSLYLLGKDSRSLATMISEEYQIVNCLGNRIIVRDSLILLTLDNTWSGRRCGKNLGLGGHWGRWIHQRLGWERN
jgi:hypothetical protein